MSLSVLAFDPRLESPMESFVHLRKGKTPRRLHADLDGLKDDRQQYPDGLSNRSAQYRHGWLNGRDDRRQRPRAAAAVLRHEAMMAKERDRYPA